MNQENKNVPVANGGGHIRRNDVIFITALLLVAMLAGLSLWLLRGEGNTVEVTVDKSLFGIYSLSEDRTVEIRTGENGEELNLLIIKDGKAYVESATCPDGICAGHKPISRKGESIVCLPHKVVITVITQSDDGPDIVA